MAETVGTIILSIVGFAEAAGTAVLTIGRTTITVADVVGAVAITAASVGIQMALAPGVPSLNPSQQQVNVRQAVAPRRYAAGRVKIGGVIAFLQNKVAANINQPGTDGQLYSLVLLAAHEIDGIEEYWIGDQLVTIDASGIVQEEPFMSEGWARAQFSVKLGTQDQTVHSILTADFPGEWTADHRLRGIANILGKFGSLEDKAFTKVFPNGIPQIRVLARTAKLWDPRAIGSDPDDETSWAFSENGALILMDYIWSENGMGLPRSLIELALDDWIEKIGIAAEEAELAAGGSEPRYRLAGVRNATDVPRDVLPLLLNPMGGTLRLRADGAIFLELPEYYEPSVIFTDDHIYSYSNIRRSPEAGDLRNEIRARFLSPPNGYLEQEAAPWRNEASISIHGTQSMTLDLSWCPSHRQSRVRQKLEAYRLAPDYTGTIVTNAYGLNCLGERLIRIQISELGLDIVAERTSFRFDISTGRCIIGFRSISAEAFAWNPDTEEGQAPIADETGGGDTLSPTSPTSLNAVNASGTVTVTFVAPNVAHLSRCHVWRGTTTFDAATRVSGAIFCSPNQALSYDDTPGPGAWKYWVTATSLSGAASAETGPAVTVAV